MQYVVLCHTNRLDRSARMHRDDKPTRDVITTHTMLTCINRDDAENMVRWLSNHDYQELEDGPFLIRRSYEVAAVFYTHGRNGRNKVTLSTSDLEMIYSEYTKPVRLAAE